MAAPVDHYNAVWAPNKHSTLKGRFEAAPWDSNHGSSEDKWEDNSSDLNSFDPYRMDESVLEQPATSLQDEIVRLNAASTSAPFQNVSTATNSPASQPLAIDSSTSAGARYYYTLPPTVDQGAAATGSTTSAASTPRPSTSASYLCLHADCDDGFTRLADLMRHVDAIHNRHSLSLIDCKVPDCNRKGELGFTRKDKAVEHLREYHKMDIPKRVRPRK